MRKEDELRLAALPPKTREAIERALPYTMTGVARLHALVEAVRYCVDAGVRGSLAECGVWRGGSVLAMVLTLQQLGVSDRDVFLFDTFEGMTAPTEHDVSITGSSALEEWHDAERTGTRLYSDLFDAQLFNRDAVRSLLTSTGYPEDRLHLVAGPVEQTLPPATPERLALLRLDTDWYESTRHELVHLFPQLSPGGVLIVDDYGHFAGCARAVDEYFADRNRPLLVPVDYTCRLALKSGSSSA